MVSFGERHQRLTDPADYPPEKVAFLQRTPAWCRRRAEELGPEVVALVTEMLGGPHPLAGLRQAQGVVRLADTYDAERLNVACGRALAAPTGRCAAPTAVVLRPLSMMLTARSTRPRTAPPAEAGESRYHPDRRGTGRTPSGDGSTLRHLIDPPCVT